MSKKKKKKKRKGILANILAGFLLGGAAIGYGIMKLVKLISGHRKSKEEAED